MKAASLLVLVLCFPALLSTQQIFTPMKFPAPEGHPGAGMAMVAEGNAGLIQVRLWEMGYEQANKDNCSFLTDPAACNAFHAHIEVEQGSDTETILLHAYYQNDDKQPTGFLAALAADQCVHIKNFFSPQFPKWVKWERRINAEPIEALK